MNQINTSAEVVERIKAYLAEHEKRAQNKGTFDPEHIHALGMADKILALTTSDLHHLLVERDTLRRERDEARNAADSLGYHCVGCGHLCKDPVKDIDTLRNSGALSCCPEREMEPLSEAIEALKSSLAPRQSAQEVAEMLAQDLRSAGYFIPSSVILRALAQKEGE